MSPYYCYAVSGASWDTLKLYSLSPNGPTTKLIGSLAVHPWLGITAAVRVIGTDATLFLTNEFGVVREQSGVLTYLGAAFTFPPGSWSVSRSAMVETPQSTYLCVELMEDATYSTVTLWCSAAAAGFLSSAVPAGYDTYFAEDPARWYDPTFVRGTATKTVNAYTVDETSTTQYVNTVTYGRTAAVLTNYSWRQGEHGNNLHQYVKAKDTVRLLTAAEVAALPEDRQNNVWGSAPMPDQPVSDRDMPPGANYILGVYDAPTPAYTGFWRDLRSVREQQ